MNDKLALTIRIYALRIRNFVTNLALCIYNRYVSQTNRHIMSNPHNMNKPYKPMKYFRIRICTDKRCLCCAFLILLYTSTNLLTYAKSTQCEP